MPGQMCLYLRLLREAKGLGGRSDTMECVGCSRGWVAEAFDLGRGEAGLDFMVMRGSGVHMLKE